MKGRKGALLKIIISAMCAVTVLENSSFFAVYGADEQSAEASSLFSLAETPAVAASTAGTSVSEISNTDASGEEASTDSSLQDISTEAALEEATIDSAAYGSCIEEESLDDTYAESELVTLGDSYVGVTFYLLNDVDAEVPTEPEDHPSENYTSGIYKSDAVSWAYLYDSVYCKDSSDEALLADRITEKNSVTDVINAGSIPTLEEIKEIYPDFSEKDNYIQWYVLKNVNGAMHVDGVVRKRVNSEFNENSEEGESTEPSEEEPDLIFEISTISDDSVVDIELDGKEHLIGNGFRIKVIDRNNPESFVESIFDKLGNLVSINSTAAAPGEGTFFSYKKHNFWVNIDAAYAKVVADSVGSLSRTIPFIFNNEEITPDRISVMEVEINDDGTIVKKPISSQGLIIKVDTDKQAEIKVNTKQRNITVEAGTTVKNDSGSTITNDSYEIISGSLLDGHRISNVVFNGSQTGAGESTNQITSLTIVDASGKEVTSLYNITYKNGRLILVDADGEDEDSTVVTTADSETNSTGNYLSSKSTGAGKTTVVNSQISFGEAPDDNLPQVLGARRSSTDDQTVNISLRVLIILICMFFGIYFQKKSEKG